MSIKYKNLIKKPRVFESLTGVGVKEFKEIVSKVRPMWEIEVLDQKKSLGRPSHLESLEDKLLCVFIYYRTYVTHEFIGFLFNLHNSNICRLFKVLEPLLSRVIKITKDRSLTKEKILELIIDVTEQPIQRPKRRKNIGKRTPKNKQKLFYSGKKKRHTVKKEIVITESGKIVGLSKTIRGKQHDYKIRKEGDRLPVSKSTLVDSAYQGLQKIRVNVMLPFKGTKKKPLTLEQKIHNKSLASARIKIEHKIRQFKVFKIVSDVYRNFGKKHNMRSNIIAGIVNLKNGL